MTKRAVQHVPSTERKAKAALYRATAEAILTQTEKWSCFALRRVGIECDDFCAVFDPGPGPSGSYWGTPQFGSGWSWGVYFTDKDTVDAKLQQEQRAIALCFMAAMVEAGDA